MQSRSRVVMNPDLRCPKISITAFIDYGVMHKSEGDA